MRQTGLMAASAAYALTHNFPRLVDVHLMARRLEQGLREIGVNILSEAETCMVRLSYVASYSSRCIVVDAEYFLYVCLFA